MGTEDTGNSNTKEFKENTEEEIYMSVFTKPRNIAFVVRNDMAQKFINHSNKRDLEIIKEDARLFNENQERLKNK